jgi:hypothetical protein
MGRHSAPQLSTRELRKAYLRLREAYESLVWDYLELKSKQHGPPDSTPGGPLSSGAVAGLVPLDVDAAGELVRSSGLLTSPGLEA